MSCKYDIIEEGGRKRVRALRHFTVQGRDVCPMELGGYVYAANTLSQDGNCWIFSGSLEYPGVRVLDEAIVDMGSNLPKAIARPKSTIISGNSRIMGAISFETQSFDVAQTPAMFEQGAYNAVVGNVPVKSNDTTRVRIPAPLFAGTAGKVAITSTAYEARLISLNEAGIVTSATAWTVGGPAVTLTSAAPYILVEVRKVGETAISPTDVTAAGITVTRAREATVRIFNSSIVPVYNGSVTAAANILRWTVTNGTSSLSNSYARIECSYNAVNALFFLADFVRVNWNAAITANVTHSIAGTFRNSNVESQASTGSWGVSSKGTFDVSDCPNFAFDAVTFPGLAAMRSSGKTFYFKQCNMPVGSAIHYYDPNVNVWDNIDFTKAMADLGKLLPGSATLLLVSSDKQGLYRVCSTVSNTFGMLVEKFSSVSGWVRNVISESYDSIIYQDCTLTGLIHIIGRNVFGGTLGGASKITNTAETAMVIDGSFRIEGNAQVTDTPLKGNGYIGGNAELKNGKVEGYIYMADNAKYIPEAVANPYIIRTLNMTGDSKVLKQANSGNHSVRISMSDNAVLDAEIFGDRGTLVMRENATITRGSGTAVTFYGALTLEGKASIKEASLIAYGDITLTGGFATSGARTITGKRVLSDISQIAVADVPPTKTTW